MKIFYLSGGSTELILYFHENIEHHANVIFCDKNFVISRGETMPTVELQAILNFRDWMPNQKIHEILCHENLELQCIRHPNSKV